MGAHARLDCLGLLAIARQAIDDEQTIDNLVGAVRMPGWALVRKVLPDGMRYPVGQAAQQNGLVVKTSRKRRNENRHGVLRTRRPPEYRYVRRVTTEALNIVSYPLQRRDDVQRTVVA